MNPLRGKEKAISFLGCLLVLSSLVAPRLVVHKHADFEDSSSTAYAFAQQALAEHCSRFHHSPGSSINPLEMHVHWGFSFPNGELPDDSPTDRGLMLAGSPADISINASHIASVTDEWRVANGTATYCMCGNRFSGSSFVSADFKRLFFGVWNI